VGQMMLVKQMGQRQWVAGLVSQIGPMELVGGGAGGAG